jgi:hypothetical protein
MPEGYQKRPGFRCVSFDLRRSRSHPHVKCFPGPDRPHGDEQLLVDGAVIQELILRHMDDHDSDATLGEILPVLEASIDGDESFRKSSIVSPPSSRSMRL